MVILCFMEVAVLEGPEVGEAGGPDEGLLPGGVDPNRADVATRFKKGYPRIASLAKKARERQPVPARVVVEKARDPLLVAYRHVLQNEDGRVDSTIVEREVRALLASHRKEFLAKWSEMEQEERSFADRSRAEGVEEDVGLEAAVGLLDRVLAEGIE